MLWEDAHVLSKNILRTVLILTAIVLMLSGIFIEKLLCIQKAAAICLECIRCGDCRKVYPVNAITHSFKHTCFIFGVL